MNIRTFARPILILILAFPAMQADGGSFRCGTRLVITGDSVNRLIESCGQPALKYKAKAAVREDGSKKMTGVTNWIYERGRRKNMVVSVRSGKVVRISVD